MDDPNKNKNDTLPERLKVIGGLIAVGIGVFAILGIAIVAIVKDTSTSSTIASAAGGVIASIVGAYFGVKIGSDQSRDANEKKDAQAARTDVYALHLSEDKAIQVRQEADTAAANVLRR